MRERPIIFCGEMVRAILDGRKTMTRRVIKPQPPNIPNGYFEEDAPGWRMYWPDDGEYDHIPVDHPLFFCPFGRVGDRLRVREKWACLDTEKQTPVIYAADRGPKDYRWRPSIHMPRWASRLTLEITGVRIERLWDISSGDCVREGVIVEGSGMLDACDLASQARDKFRDLWDSLHARDGYEWAANPWVWVIAFRRKP